jgi:uncharacterized protein (DUF1684 family)
MKPLTKQEVEIILRLIRFGLSELKNWMTPEEFRIMIQLQDKLHTESIELHNREGR